MNSTHFLSVIPEDSVGPNDASRSLFNGPRDSPFPLEDPDQGLCVSIASDLGVEDQTKKPLRPFLKSWKAVLVAAVVLLLASIAATVAGVLLSRIMGLVLSLEV